MAIRMYQIIRSHSKRRERSEWSLIGLETIKILIRGGQKDGPLRTLPELEIECEILGTILKNPSRNAGGCIDFQ